MDTTPTRSISQTTPTRSISQVDENRPSLLADIPHFPHQDEDQLFIETFFDEGPLGVTLKRRNEDGVVYIGEIVPNSQAVNIDVQQGDELWVAADQEIGGVFIDQDAWKGLVNFIKVSERPLRLVWRRPKQKSVPSPPPQQQQAQQQREGSVSPPPAPKSDEPSAEYLALKNALVRLIIKDKETGVFGGGSSVAKKPAFPDPMSFLKEGRKLVKQGDLAIETKSNSIWSRAPNKRRLTLLSDTLIISIPQSGNVAALEYVIDLQICKVKSLGHVFTLHQSGSDDTQNEDDLSFELLWPGGDIHLIADNLAMKEEWVLYIYHAICDSVAGTVQYLGWRHQYLVGTMHSAVLTRNEERVKELIALCKAEKLDFKAIESFDEDGYTPLHYACMLRLQNIVRLLHEATADVTATDNNGLTPLHWAALQLDDYSLTLLCSHVFDIDLLDRKQRSPLVIACLEGRDISGVTDVAALTRCLEVMVTHKPNLSWKDDLGRSLLHYLAASWQHEPMEVLLENGCVEVNSFEDEFGMPPLHFACRASPIKNAIGEGFKIMNDGKSTDYVDNQPEPINSPCGIDTLRILLQYGAKPNMKDRMGRTALQILFLPENEILWEKEELEPAVALLLSYGCRLPNEEMINVIKAKFPELNVLALFEKWNALPPIDGTKIGLRINHYEPLPDVGAEQTQSNSPTPMASVKADQKPGTFCTMCSFQFTMFKRQHHCRLCNGVCCDDCSKKRVFIDGKEQRSCDCCFNRALSAYDKFNAKALIASIKPLSSYQKENDAKKDLFRSTSGQSPDGKQQQQAQKGGVEPIQKVSGGVAGTMATMNETHEKLLERGEKLSQLSDRTEQLSNQANEFAKLAKQLNEQQKSRWF